MKTRISLRSVKDVIPEIVPYMNEFDFDMFCEALIADFNGLSLIVHKYMNDDRYQIDYSLCTETLNYIHSQSKRGLSSASIPEICKSISVLLEELVDQYAMFSPWINSDYSLLVGKPLGNNGPYTILRIVLIDAPNGRNYVDTKDVCRDVHRNTLYILDGLKSGIGESYHDSRYFKVKHYKRASMAIKDLL